jgi:hypothetical protein
VGDVYSCRPLCSPPTSFLRWSFSHPKLTKLTNLNVEDCELCEDDDTVLPEPNFPVKPNEFIGRHVYLDAFAEALEYSKTTGRMASFAVLGDWGIGKSSLLLKLAAASSDS